MTMYRGFFIAHAPFMWYNIYIHIFAHFRAKTAVFPLRNLKLTKLKLKLVAFFSRFMYN